MLLSHKIKLYPTARQERLLRQSCGVARFAFNWALNHWESKRKCGETTSAYSLIKELTIIKRQQFPWMLEVSKTCPQYAIHNLERAFKNFFKGGAKYPHFKKKGQRDSFVAVENKEQFNQKGFRIHIPRIGKIKCAENLRFGGKVNNVVVSRTADIWFASVNVEMPDRIIHCENQAVVGIDLGIKTLMTLSDGTVFENPKPLRNQLKQLKRLQRSLARKKKGSKNRRKAQMMLARKHYRISCIRKTVLYQSVSKIVKAYGGVVVEDLNVEGMLRNHKLAQAISDASFNSLLCVLERKAKEHGVSYVVADRYFPSSKTCSNCGHKKGSLKLSERTFNCENCGHIIDRDLNAAINLSKYKATPKSGESQACGERSSLTRSDSPSMNQESNLITNKI